MRSNPIMAPSARPSPRRRQVWPRWIGAGLLAFAGSLNVTAQSDAPGTAPGGVKLPTLGDSVSGELDVSAERKLGDQVMREIRRDPDVLDDPLLLGYIESIWASLMRAARQRGDIGSDIERGFAWETFLVRDRGVNAFALPGGYMGVYLGLVAITSTRDELAAVMAHEMAHLTQRHIARSITSSSRQSIVGLAAMLAAVVAASKSNNINAVQAAVVGSQALVAQAQLNFSRDMEREADRVGFGIFAGASFAPGGVAAMFEKLEAANRLNDAGNFPYLRSHPLTVERIGDARARVEADRQAKAALPSLEHELMRARARVLMDPRAEALRRVQTGTASIGSGTSPIDRVALLYAAALASLQLREPAAAVEQARLAETALRAVPGRNDAAQRIVRLLMAQAAALAGQGGAALASLDQQADGSRAAVLTRAHVALDLARASGPGSAAAGALLRPSQEVLQTWVTERRQDALAWSTLAQIHELGGFRLRAMRAQAESSAALGDLRGAIDRLRAGQRMAREGAPGSQDAIESAVIDARVRELVALYRELYPDLRTHP